MAVENTTGRRDVDNQMTQLPEATTQPNTVPTPPDMLLQLFILEILFF